MYIAKRLASLLLLLPTASGLATPVADRLEMQLRADQHALETAERNFTRQRTRGLSNADTADYTNYLDGLREQVLRDCVALARETAAPLPADLPCDTVPALNPAATRVDPQTVRSDDEEIGALDAELDGILSEYDELLLREQARIKAATPRTTASSAQDGGSGSNGGGNAGGGGGATGDGSGSKGGQQSSSTQTADGSATSGRRDTTISTGATIIDPAGGQGAAGASGRQAARGQPASIPDGQDDNIVARQIREMAEKEKNPEKRKQYWEEYRNYKEESR